MFTKQLDLQKSMGIDGIGPSVLNHSAMALFRPLHHLFLLSLSQNYIPEEWRVHLITPILESGDASSVANYRPIFLSPRYLKDVSILKLSILSLIVYVQLSLDFCRSIPPCISYFCSWTIFLMSFKGNGQTDVIYLDFRKAFDSVAHNELLTKLWMIGITGTLWEWFRAYVFVF